jgi:hypothetical protein
MTTPIVNEDWLNANSLRKYPLSEEATAKDESDSFSLPDDLIVDLIFPVHAMVSLDVSKFHVGSINIFGTGVTISLAHDGVFIGSISVDAASFTRNQTFFLAGTGDFSDSIGKIVIGSLETILKSAGSFVFSVDGGRLEPRVIVPGLRGVTSLIVQNGAELSPLLQDDVVLRAGRNISFEVSPGVGDIPDEVIVNAINGEGLNIPCDCDEDLPEGPPIRTINEIGPNAQGNFELLEDDCIKLEDRENGIQMRDECSKPCCGCSELDVINQDLQRLNDQVLTLIAFGQRLDGVTSNMQAVILASKISSAQTG